MKRGDIWDIDFPGAGRHPGLGLTSDVLLARLGRCTVALVTHTEGPASTHVPVGPPEGCDESFVNLTDIHTVRARNFKRKRGEVDWRKGRQINYSLIRTLDLDQP